MITLKKSALVLLILYLGHQAYGQETAVKPPESAALPTQEKPDQGQANRIELPFSVVDAELKIANPQLSFDMKSSNGKELKIGSVVFNNDSFKVKAQNSILKLKWDSSLIKSGEVTMFDRLGKSLWSYKVKDVGSWEYGQFREKVAPLISIGDKLRFCLSSGENTGFTILCSEWYVPQKENNDIVFYSAKAETSPRIIVNKNESQLSGLQKMAVGEQMHFFAVLRTDATYEFQSEPLQPNIRDMVEGENKGEVLLSGEVPEPLGLDVKISPEKEETAFVKSIGFEDTILPNPMLWKTQLKDTVKLISFPGKFGGVFEYPIEIKDTPSLASRMYISKRTPRGTYLDQDQLEVFNEKNEPQMWSISAAEKFKANRNYLEVKGEKISHKVYLDVYRGTSREISGRFTGMLSEAGFLAFGEAHLSWWFNDLFGWQNYYLSKQRWGVSAKQFTALTGVSAQIDGGNQEGSTLSVLDVDLRYRFTPGLWERDETVGFILGYETGQFGRYSLGKIGVGLFWARSMPKVFDDWMNTFSFMRYPKWVDMEFINYMSSSQSDVSLQGDFVINFHGKILWTPTLFGEAGFGYKKYAFQIGPDQEYFSLQTLYGTLGLGLNF